MKRSRLKPVNPERRAETHAVAFGAKGTWIRAHPCIVHGCWRHPIHAAHAIARGRGSAKGDKRHLVPLCWLHHREAGEYRTAARRLFEIRHELTRGEPGEGLVLIAEEFDARWEAGEDYGAPW